MSESANTALRSSASAHNHQNIAKYTYLHTRVTKQELSRALDLSLPTVNKNVTKLLNDGYIVPSSEMNSTGGRKAQSYAFNRNLCCAIGLSIARESVNMCAVNLNGTVIAQHRAHLKFADVKPGDTADNPRSKAIKKFIKRLEESGCPVLGVAYGIHGFLSPNSNRFLFGTLQNNVKLTNGLGGLEDYLGKPCSFIHDSYASALVELWKKPSLRNALCLYLGPRLGGAIILDGKINRGQNMRNGAIEHMTLVPDGRQCYCGKKGCVSPYCSTDFLLEDDPTETLPTFFKRAHSGEETAVKKLDEWLTYLALAISNATFLFSCDIIIGGEASMYLTDEDLASLKDKISNLDSLDTASFELMRSVNEPNQEKVGLALHFVEPFLRKVCGPLNS